MTSNRSVNKARLRGAAAIVILSAASAAIAQPTVAENGFRVRTFEGCANFPGPAFFGINDAVCGSGTAFGEYVYYTVAFPEDEAKDHVARMSMRGREETFAAGIDFNSTIVLSPSRSFAGERLIVEGLCPGFTLFGGHAFFTPSGAYDRCIPNESRELPPGPSVFDFSGQHGFDMFVSRAGSILRVSYFGDIAVFSPSTGPGEVKFGPGGAWGSDLYVAGGGIVDAAGNLSLFPYAFQEWDWLEGLGWDGDMFDLCGGGRICRVRPDGAASLFATDVTGHELVACGGHLWIMSAENCVRITARRGRAVTTISPSSLNVDSAGSGFSINTTLTDADTGELLDVSLVGDAWISSVASAAIGRIVLPTPRAEAGCDSATEDGLWETLSDRVAQGGGSVTLRFNTASDGSCETRDGNRQDLIALLLGVPDGETAAVCFQAPTPELAAPVEGCGEVTVLNRGNR